MASEGVVRFAKITDKGFMPVKGSSGAAGFDLKSAYSYTIPPHGKEIINTDIRIKLPPGCYGRIAPRSGLAAKNFIDVGAGVIDGDYRGNIGVVLFNHSDKEFVVRPGDRIAQLICEQIFYPEMMEVDELSDTERGADGFGSTDNDTNKYLR
jgi:dUTP pyrophosphatase